MNDDVLIQLHIAGNQSEKMLNSKQIALMLISALMCRFQELLLRCKKGLILHYFLRMQAKLMNFSPAASAFLIHTIFSFFSSQSKDVIIRQCFAFMYELNSKVALKLMRKSGFSKKKEHTVQDLCQHGCHGYLAPSDQVKQSCGKSLAYFFHYLNKVKKVILKYQIGQVGAQ